MFTAALLLLLQTTNPTAEPSPSPAPAATPAPERKLAFGGAIRLRPEYRHDFGTPFLDGTHVLARTRAWVSLDTAHVRGLVELQDARLFGTETSPTSNEKNVDLHQAFLTFGPRDAQGFTARLGRQEMAYGDARLVGNSDWGNTGRSFDAAVLRWGWDAGSIDAFTSLVNDRKAAGRGEGSQLFSGVYAQLLRDEPGREVDAYALLLSDDVEQKGELNGSDDVRLWTIGARGKIDRKEGLFASAEAALQRGHSGPDSVEAYAFAVVGGWNFGGSWKPAVRLEVDGASGDGESKDGVVKEFNNLFPTNHGQYGYADIQGWRNMRDFRAGVAVTPVDEHNVSADLHVFRLAEQRGAWKDDGGVLLGQDLSGEAGKDLARELDVLWRWTVRPDLGVLGGVSVVWLGDAGKKLRSGGNTWTVGYAQVQLKF